MKENQKPKDMTSDWKKELPMKITLSRIFLVPIIVVCMGQQDFYWRLSATLLFICGSITDYYDGYFARKYQATSDMGKFMDPIADKILVTSVLIMLLARNSIDPYMVIITLVRDTLIGGIRSIAAKNQIVIDAKSAGKIKTALQMVAIPAIILGPIPNVSIWLHKIGYILLWISTILSLTSGIEYYISYRKSTRH